jgi:hypothetical protein
MRRGNWIVAVLALATAAAAMGPTEKVRMQNWRVWGGSHDPAVWATVAPEQLHMPRGTLDSIGTVYEAGNTYYDQQHNGTAGKMIGVDESGFVHVVWMKGLTSDNNGARHVYYNIWDPSSATWGFNSGGVPSGVVIDAAQRAGYICLALLPNGWVFPGFHMVMANDPNAHSGAAIDLMPGTGIFNTTRPAYLYENGESLELIWPKIAVGRDSVIHMVSCENPASGVAGDYQRIYYSRGHPQWDEDGLGVQIVWEPVDGTNQFMEIDTVMVIGVVVAASQRSDRVAIAYPRPRCPSLLDTTLRNQGDNDVHVIVSEDGGLNWGQVINVTDFAAPDTACVSGDTAVCERDTFRVYTDCAALFDRCDRLHLAFTTHLNFLLAGLAAGYHTGWYMAAYRLYHSDIWHWNEEYNEISNVTRGNFLYNTQDSTIDSYWYQIGAWQLMVQRPSLAEDSATGYLYCSYQRYDTAQISAAGYPMSEAYLAVSRNGGRSWSAGTDVTHTIADSGAPAGQCKHERDITIADNVSYSNGEGFVHMFYVYDGDAGTPLQSEGAVTLNPVRYQRIPISAIPATPINPNWRLNMHADGSHAPSLTNPEEIVACTPASVTDHQALLPGTFRLYQNYPNPFNPITNIQFDLARDAKVTLKVYNVLGQEVATLFDGKPLHAGVQTATFDASALASGVYMYRLNANGVTATRKMILMK